MSDLIYKIRYRPDNKEYGMKYLLLTCTIYVKIEVVRLLKEIRVGKLQLGLKELLTDFIWRIHGTVSSLEIRFTLSVFFKSLDPCGRYG